MSTQITSIPCAACQRLNLPGGVRCAYCGTPYPPVLDFDLGASTPPPTLAPVATATPAATQQGRKASVISTLALLLFKGKSLLTLLKFGKVALTLSTMLISIAAYSRIYTWRFAIGLVLCILIHEMGHVVVNWRKGIKQTAPMFIPFVGALIAVKSFPDDPAAESECGAGGPIAGALAAVICVLIGTWTHQPFWFALAATGFIINLFNLIPVWQLDGAHIVSVFSPKVWNGCMLAMLLIAIKAPVPLLWALLLTNFLARVSQFPSKRYILARPQVGLRMAVIYVLLCTGLCYGVHVTGTYYGMERRPEFVLRRPTQAPQSITHSSADVRTYRVAASSLPGQQYPTRRAATSLWNDKALLGFAVTLLITMLLLTIGLWILTSYLLHQAASLPFRVRGLMFPGAMLSILVILTGGVRLLPIAAHNAWMLLGAYLAAMGTALVYAGYQAVHLARKSVRPGYMALLAGCLGWACGGALLIAYSVGSWLIAGCVVALALAFYLRYPAMLFGLLADGAASLGEYPRSMRLLQQALVVKPKSDVETQAQTWNRLTHLYLLQDRGGEALQALDTKEAIWRAAVEGVESYAPGLTELEQRASALILLDRFDEALACCEQMLRVSPEDTLGALRLLAVHIRLGRIAHYRGWEEEAVAQSDWCLRLAAKLSKPLVARLYAGRAAALAAMGRADEARQACEQALQAAGESYVQAWTAAIQAQLCLAEGNATEAEREAARALRLMPDNIQYRYWHGVALLAGERTQEGKALLKDLAACYAEEHWGRRAQAALTSNSI